jgi:hypothetical protein
MPDHGLEQARGEIIDSGALACRIDTYHGATPEPELSQCMFYMLANAFTQLSRGGPLPPKAEFWNPSTPLPFEMRDAITLFEEELTKCSGRTAMLDSPRFLGMLK